MKSTTTAVQSQLNALKKESKKTASRVQATTDKATKRHNEEMKEVRRELSVMKQLSNTGTMEGILKGQLKVAEAETAKHLATIKNLSKTIFDGTPKPIVEERIKNIVPDGMVIPVVFKHHFPSEETGVKSELSHICIMNASFVCEGGFSPYSLGGSKRHSHMNKAFGLPIDGLSQGIVNLPVNNLITSGAKTLSILCFQTFYEAERMVSGSKRFAAKVEIHSYTVAGEQGEQGGINHFEVIVLDVEGEEILKNRLETIEGYVEYIREVLKDAVNEVNDAVKVLDFLA